MKKLSFVILIALAFSVVSCGNKNETGGSTSLSSSEFRSVRSYINTQNGAIEYGNTIYQPASQQTVQVLSQAIQLGQQQGIQPVLDNGVYKWRVNMTAMAVQQQFNQQYNQQYQNTGAVQYINVQTAVVY